MDIGVIGLGAVGSTIQTALSLYHNVKGYDTNKESDNWNDILDTDAVFIAVPTPQGENGRLDCSAVQDTLQHLKQDNYQGVICIESTLHIGFLSESDWSNHLNIVYRPEWLRERSRLKFFTNPDRIMIAGNIAHCEKILEALKPLTEGDTPITITDYRTAEVTKVLHNAHIAVMVSTTNEFRRIAEEHGVEPMTVMKGIWQDHRRSNAWMHPYKGSFTDSACVPKDTNEVRYATELETDMLDAAFKANDKTDEADQE